MVDTQGLGPCGLTAVEVRVLSPALMQIKDKIVLVTGASKGIGKATAIAFAKEGASVILNFKSDLKAARLVLEECNSYSSNNLLIQADIADEKSVRAMFTEIKDHYGHLDVFAGCAGIFDERESITNIEVFENTYHNNFLSYVQCTKYLLPLMKKGKIVYVSSINGKLGEGVPEEIAYSAFKAALENYTKNLAKALAPDILVNAVAPGRTATAMWGNPDAKQQIEYGKAQLIKRMIQPEEIADAILFLAKNDAMCGEILTIDGGNSLMS